MTDSGAAAAFLGRPERSLDPSVHSDSAAQADAQIVPLPIPAPSASPETTTRSAKWIGMAGLVALGISLFLTYFGTFMIGLFGLATTVAAIGFLRATLPRATMSWFASRNRALDCTLYFGFALALGVLALGIPQ